ncbi:MAG TPA: hypothetical protein VN956_18890 [Pyrinomonadaceae bacterium]|nr:hypothetical protein [Pyrinomonadaceae bacterium]
MKRLILLSLLISLGSITAYGQIAVTCPAPPFKAQSAQYRGDVKHRTPGSPTGTVIGAANMYGFPNVTVAAAGAAKHAPMPGSKETQTFTLDAFLWQAKVEGNDCEIHLELNDSSIKSTSRRVIVEIPPDTAFDSDYQAILRLVQQTFPGTTIGQTYPLDLRRPFTCGSLGFGSLTAFTRVSPRLVVRTEATVLRRCKLFGNCTPLGMW